MSDAPDSEDEETLLLNVFQSVLERQPKVEPLAVLQTSAPAEVVSPVPILLNAVPLRLMTRGESPFTVAVAETKRFVEDAVPVVVLLEKTPPEAETFVTFTFPPWRLFTLMFPVKVEVALPVTASAPVVEVLVT